MNTYFTPAEIADQLRLSKDAVYRAIDRGDLRAVKVASRLRVSHTDLDAWLALSTVGAVSSAPNIQPIREATA